MRKLLFFVLAISLLSCNEAIEVDTIIHNATIYTVDDIFSKHSAMAINDGIIVEIGAENQILNKYIATNKVDAKQQFVYPGFIDAHCHFMGYGIEKNRVNLAGTKSFKEVVDRIKEYIETHDTQWVLGRGWDQNDWPIQEFPTNDTLSKLFPNKFIAVRRIDGHAMLASKNVLEKAGINANTSIAGGEVILQNGKPTGVLIDEAMTFVNNIIPEPNTDYLVEALNLAQTDCFALGLTSVSDAGLSVRNIHIIDSLQQTGILKMRMYAMLSADNSILHNLESLELHTDRLDVNSVKIYADGALGSRGAYLLSDYSDHENHRGLLITSEDSLKKWAKACFDANFQMNVHCVGDGANHLVLDAMGYNLQGTNDRRWRIEHAQVISDADMNKFSEYTIIPSVQPTHATSDMPWAEERLGHDRMHGAYAYQTLLNQNGMIALGTDFPVEEISPFKTFYAAVERKDADGNPPGGFIPGEALTREQTLRGMTIWAAVSNFQEQNRGSLEVGKFADFIILNDDLLHCTPEAILNAQVVQTWINGELVYKN